MSPTSSVFQNLQSCLEPLSFEPHDLMRQLTPSKQALSSPWPQKLTEIENPKTEKALSFFPFPQKQTETEIEKSKTEHDLSSFSFPQKQTEIENSQAEQPLSLFPFPQKQTEIETSKTEQALSFFSFLQSKTEFKSSKTELGLSFPWPHKLTEIDNSKTEQIYVHPLAKRSSSSLSTKSLEMCTESLGSETGNDIISNFEEYSYNALEKQSPCRKKPTRNQEFAKKIKKATNFPPPLTSISGNEGVQVQTHREGGRLVIKAFNVPSCRNYFQAERENGRLKLSFVKIGFRDSESELSENEEEEEEDEVNKAEDEDESDNDDKGDINGRIPGENNNNNLRDDGGKIGCKINGGDWSGGSRCNGDTSSRSKRLPSLPCCVAIS